MTCTESNQKHLDHQQVHNMNRLEKAVEAISEDEAVEEPMDLAVAMDMSPAITVEEHDIMLGTARTLLQHASTVSPMTIQLRSVPY